MQIKLPLIHKARLEKMKESDVLLVGFMHMLKLKYMEYDWFSVWKYDVSVITGATKLGITPAFMFQGTTEILRAAYVQNHKLDVSFKKWSEATYDYELTEFRNEVVWSMILDGGNTGTYAEQAHKMPKEKDWNRAHFDKRNIISAIKNYKPGT